MPAATTKLQLSNDDKKYLQSLTKARTMQAQVVDRARILLLKAEGQSFQTIADKLGVTVKTVQLCISKYKNGGI
uniref:helix-turn-helix domain-containing protein n=1 Tax=Acetatifactor sp. TaxID=1872090 RepID=UPI004056B04D